MHVLIISECSGNALTESRRILDQFAERKGERTWQTPITMEGLSALRTMLKKTARRNTAVACHWIKSANRTEFLWIVGKISTFNEDGTVPTNYTHKNVLRQEDENDWTTLESIALIAGLAGLFHDFGKATKLFQDKLFNLSRFTFEPYRHEWISLRLFQALVNKQDDELWLQRLAVGDMAETERYVFNNLEGLKDTVKRALQSPNPFHKTTGLNGNLAKIIGWLIVSHHRLPIWEKPTKRQGEASQPEPKIERIDKWLYDKEFNVSWNSDQSSNEWTDEEWSALWTFPSGTPLLSSTWQKKAKSIAERALKHKQLFANGDWLSNRFSSHLARLSLMFADHTYSAGDTRTKWRDPTYNIHANTDRKTRIAKQQLDEHNIGVSAFAYMFAKRLPNFINGLPAIGRHKELKKRITLNKYRWQNLAYDLSLSIATATQKQGFFGVNMASTGCGKTLANAKIMYGLAAQGKGARFTVALGLRNLTLQTGQAFREKLKFDEDDLAVLIGSDSTRDLFNLNNLSSIGRSEDNIGSESASELFAEHQYIKYEGSMYHGHLDTWFKNAPKLHRLLSAPILVCTIDQLIEATESLRGGGQLAPLLRLLSSDLVLDEPDDFGVEDVPALCRFINWAGLFGARVLLSSATMPPSLISGLFDSYQNGRRYFNESRNIDNKSHPVICGWFDETAIPIAKAIPNLDSFCNNHADFVGKRCENIAKNTPKQIGKIIQNTSAQDDDIENEMVSAISNSIIELHSNNHLNSIDGKRKISFGIVRFAVTSRSPKATY